MILMTPDAGRLARLLDTSAGLLVAEAETAAAGWRFVTVGGLETDSEADLGRYEQVLDAFDAAAGGRHCCLFSISSRLTFGICGADAEQRITWLRARLEELNPAGLSGDPRWEIRDSAR